MADNAAYAMNWLLKKGYLPHQAAAMVGHGMQESGLRTDVVGDNGTAKGAFQWRGDRLQGLYSYAKSTGQDVNSLDTQLGYMDHELNTTEKRAGDALRASTDVRGATRAGMMFERPAGYTAANPEAGHGWANRFGLASKLAGVPIDPNAAPVPTTGPAPAMLQAAPLMAQTPIAAAFMPAPQEDEIAKRRAMAVAQEEERRRALLGGGTLFG